MQPSPLLASVRPDLTFDPQRYVACDDVFVARVMEPTDACVQAMTEGVGMPDRANRGWITLNDGRNGGAALQAAGVPLAVEGRRVPCLGRDEAAAYRFEDVFMLDVPRTQRAVYTDRLRGAGPDIEPNDVSAEMGRVGLMGRDARKLLSAIGLNEMAVLEPGSITRIEVLEEPVILAHSDFAGPQGYDLLIARGMFNAMLAVICSWAVRLELQLLPCGTDAVDAVWRSQQH